MTVATTLLKPGGSDRMTQIAQLLEEENAVFTGVSVEGAKKLADDAKTSPCLLYTSRCV